MIQWPPEVQRQIDNGTIKEQALVEALRAVQQLAPPEPKPVDDVDSRVKYYQDREAEFIKALGGVCDNGQYRADIVTKINSIIQERDELKAARIAYAREFPPDENGDPDVGRIHENLRALKLFVERLVRYAVTVPTPEEHEAFGNRMTGEPAPTPWPMIAENFATAILMGASKLGIGGGWAMVCPTCHEPYEPGKTTVCSNAFHLCRDCVRFEGRVIKACKPVHEPLSDSFLRGFSNTAVVAAKIVQEAGDIDLAADLRVAAATLKGASLLRDKRSTQLEAALGTALSRLSTLRATHNKAKEEVKQFVVAHGPHLAESWRNSLEEICGPVFTGLREIK